MHPWAGTLCAIDEEESSTPHWAHALQLQLYKLSCVWRAAATPAATAGPIAAAGWSVPSGRASSDAMMLRRAVPLRALPSAPGRLNRCRRLLSTHMALTFLSFGLEKISGAEDWRDNQY